MKNNVSAPDIFGILNRGQVVPMTHFTFYGGRGLSASYSAAPDKRFVFLLLGMEGRNGQDQLDAVEVLYSMGWKNEQVPRKGDKRRGRINTRAATAARKGK